MDREEALRFIGHLRVELPDLDPLLYRLAQFVATETFESSVPDPGRCRGCGTELPRRRVGRPRKWCSDACRNRARRSRDRKRRPGNIVCSGMARKSSGSDQYLVRLSDVAIRCGGVGDTWGGATDFTRAMPVLEMWGLDRSEVRTDWAGKPAVPASVAARIVTGYEREQLANVKASEKKRAAAEKRQAEKMRSRYLDSLTKEVVELGYESIDDWLDALGYEDLDEYHAAREEERRRHLGGLPKPTRSGTSSDEYLAVREGPTDPREREAARRQTIAKVKTEFEANYPR